jgi:hypothetical protein
MRRGPAAVYANGVQVGAAAQHELSLARATLFAAVAGWRTLFMRADMRRKPD